MWLRHCSDHKLEAYLPILNKLTREMAHVGMTRCRFTRRSIPIFRVQCEKRRPFPCVQSATLRQQLVHFTPKSPRVFASLILHTLFMTLFGRINTSCMSGVNHPRHRVVDRLIGVVTTPYALYEIFLTRKSACQPVRRQGYTSWCDLGEYMDR